MCKVYTGYCGTSEIEHGLCACTVNNPLAKARGLSLRTGAQTMLYLSHVTPNQTAMWSGATLFLNEENSLELDQTALKSNQGSTLFVNGQAV